MHPQKLQAKISILLLDHDNINDISRNVFEVESGKWSKQRRKT